MGAGRGVLPAITICGQSLLGMNLGDGKGYSHISSKYVHPPPSFLVNPVTPLQTETFIPGAQPSNPSLHGTSGPISAIDVTTSHPSRQYPLRYQTSIMLENTSYTLNLNGNPGSVKGYCELTKNWINHPASVTYEVARCKNVTILT